MTDLQAALGLSQLKKLDGFLSRRREISAYYDKEFSNIDNVFLLQSKKYQRAASGQHLYILDIDFQTMGITRTSVMQSLRAKGIGSQVHYIPVHSQLYQREMEKYDNENFQNANRYYNRCLSIPLFPAMTDLEVEYVSSQVKNILK